MCVHIAETIIDPLGRVVLDQLPFRPGDKVEVIIRTQESRASQTVDLRGSVLRYEDPFESVASNDWDIQP